MYMSLDQSILQCKTTAKIIKVLNNLHNNPNDQEARSNAESLIIQWQRANKNKEKHNYKDREQKTNAKQYKIRQNSQ